MIAIAATLLLLTAAPEKKPQPPPKKAPVEKTTLKPKAEPKRRTNDTPLP